jgi:hypothetical protein
MTEQRHNWQIAPVVTDGKSIYAVAVCDRCGVSRSAPVGFAHDETHLDLRGECPGAPQEPHTVGRPVVDWSPSSPRSTPGSTERP